MKKLFSIAAIVMIGALAFTSCKKSDNSSSNGTLTATAGTTSINSSYCAASLLGTNLGIGSVNLSSGTLAYPYITLQIGNFTTAGTYTMDGVTTGAGYIVGSNASDIKTAAYGTIVVTSVSSTQVSGTFSFTCTDSTKVTNGSFTAKGTSL